MKKMFGTDGVRGVVNQELTVELALRLAKAAAAVLGNKSEKSRIVMGRDTRCSGEMFSQAMAAGTMSEGIDVLDAGVIPTPAISRFVRSYQADYGIMISASHNPAIYNGIKFFDSLGNKLTDAVECEIEAVYQSAEVHYMEATVGTYQRIDAQKQYEHDCMESVGPLDLHGITVVLDGANGANYLCAPSVFRTYGADVIAMGVTPDGYNINQGCGSTDLKALSARVVEEKAAIGLAYDGDADRFLAVDEQGALIDGDCIMLVIADYLKRHQRLVDQTVVATVMSNLGFEKTAEQWGLRVRRTKVGDRYVFEEMVSSGFSIGGEQSGHVILLDYNSTGDGLLTSLFFVKAMIEKGESASALRKSVQQFPQVIVNASVSNELKNKYQEYDVINQAIAAIEKKYQGNGRVVIRPSGTEPLVRVMIEGKEQALIDKDAKELAQLMEETMSRPLEAADK